MRSEVATDGEIGIDDFATGATDAPSVGAVATQRAVAAGVWAATRHSPEHADVVAAGLPASWRAVERRLHERPGPRRGGVHRSAMRCLGV